MELSLGKLLTKRASMHPQKTAFKVLESSDTYTFQQYENRAIQTANLFLQLGVKHGDRVGVLMLNCAEYMQAFFACAKLGAVCVPMNWRLATAEISYIVQDAGIKVLLYSGEFSNQVKDLAKIDSTLQHVEHFLFTGQSDNPFARHFNELRDQQSLHLSRCSGSNNDLCMIMYTSGTTGHPKGAMHTHHTMMWALITLSATINTTGLDRFITAMPFFHIGALAPVLMGVYDGFTLLCVQKFAPDTFWQQIEAERATETMLVPAMLNFMLHVKEKDTCDVSSLKWIMTGGAPVPVSLIKAYQAKGIEIHQVYGMTESAGPACLISEKNAIERAGSAGKGFLHTQVKVVRPDGTDVEPGEKGEVLVKGEHIMKGYWNLEEKTKEVLKDGWYYSGDAGQIDEDGFIYIVDRMKDMIISGGENIYPAEIEAALVCHPDVKEVAVVGKADEKWGEVPVAFVCKNKHTLDQAALLQHLEPRLARFKTPQAFHFIDLLPRNSSGKVLKTELRKQL